MCKIMDVTLRDGSYAVNFQFTQRDTFYLVKQLEKAGMEYIEIGHGMGIGASSAKNGIAVASDMEYLAAAKRASSNCKIGMFCIPGIADVKDLTLLAKNGLDFVRVGTNVGEVEQSAAYIDCAKNLGLTVMSNYMKSYTVEPHKFSEKVKLSVGYGTDVIYIVDSAGGMFPAHIKGYYDAIKDVADIETGFHGHNNLGLAVANALYAKQLGVSYIDCSLQGLGRSAGNTATEQFVACLNKDTSESSIDLKLLCENGSQYIHKYILKRGINATDLYCGLYDFHSSYLKHIYIYSAKYDVDPLDLIEAYSDYDKVNMNEVVLQDIAMSLPKSSGQFTFFEVEDSFGNEQGN